MYTSECWPASTLPQVAQDQYCGDGARWYALHTRSQHEKSVVSHLQRRGLTTFLPLVSEIHRWSDRQKVVQLPLFSCYAFVYMRLVPETWSSVMSVTGVLSFVGARREGIPIPDSQIHAVQALLSSKLEFQICPFLEIGQRVRIRGGMLHGVEGILKARNGDRVLIIAVEPVQRSLSVRIDDYKVEPI
jgi:transcriptional antiterminator NusG